VSNGRLIINGIDDVCPNRLELLKKIETPTSNLPTVGKCNASCFRSRHPSQSYSDGEEKEQAGEIFALNMELHKLIYF
jgi:hypothetical protein